MEVVFFCYVSTHTITLILPLGPTSLMCFISGPCRGSSPIPIKDYSLNALPSQFFDLFFIDVVHSVHSWSYLRLVVTKLQSLCRASESTTSYHSCSCHLVLRFQQSFVCSSTCNLVTLPPFHCSLISLKSSLYLPSLNSVFIYRNCLLIFISCPL